jgi:hypothetical protein
MGGSWLAVVVKVVVLMIVVPTMIVISIVGTLLTTVLGGGRPYRSSSFGFLEDMLDPTRHLTGLTPGVSGTFSGQLFDMLMRSLNGGGRSW